MRIFGPVIRQFKRSLPNFNPAVLIALPFVMFLILFPTPFTSRPRLDYAMKSIYVDRSLLNLLLSILLLICWLHNRVLPLEDAGDLLILRDPTQIHCCKEDLGFPTTLFAIGHYTSVMALQVRAQFARMWARTVGTLLREV